MQHSRGTPAPELPGSLLEAIRQREAWAFEQVWSMAAAGRAAVLRIVRRPEVADDVVQETVIRTMERLPDWVEPSGLGRWMQVVALNLARDFHREHARRPTTCFGDPSLLFIPDTPSPLDTAEYLQRESEAHHVRRVLEDLPPRDAALLLARDMEGRTVADLAAKYALTEGSMRVALSRARQRFRALWAKHGLPIPY